MNESLDTLTIDADGWLLDVHGAILIEPVPVPVYGSYPREQLQADIEAVALLHRRIKRSGIDLSDEAVFYDFVTGPAGERVYTVRVGLPVNEARPMTMTEEVFA